MAAGQAGGTDKVEEIVTGLTPVVADLLRRSEGEEFTTTDFIALMRSDPEGEAAYDAALSFWGENERTSKMVIHGQVIPLALRRTGLVEWIGYAHGEADDYAVPAWWRLLPGGATT